MTIGYLFRRHRAASVAVLALVALLLTATVAEFAARGLLHSRLATAAGRALGKDSDVHIDGGPALLDLYDRHLDVVTISSDDATLGRIPGVSIQARLDDIRLADDASGTVGHTQADVEVPANSIQNLAATSGGRLPVTAVHLDDEGDTITLALGQGGLGQATLQPQLQDGRLILHLEDAEFLGSPAPDALLDQIQNGLADRSGTDYPLGLRATSLDVTATSLDITLTGGHARLPAKGDAR